MMFLALVPCNFQHLSFRCRFRGSSIKVSLGSAICSDVANASTAETFVVSPNLSSTFSIAFARIVLGFRENLLTVSDLHTVQFSIFTLHKLVAPGTVVAVFIAQTSHHHVSKTAGATANDSYYLSLHLCIVWEQVLLCCQFFLKICRTHGEENSKSHVFG